MEPTTTDATPAPTTATITFDPPLTVATGTGPAVPAPADQPQRVYEAGPATPGAGHILESLDDGEGYVWRVTMVQPGWSVNGRRYRPEVLEAAAPLYEGARSFDGHRSPEDRRSSRVTGLVGFHDNVTPAATGGALESDFHIAEGREDMRALFLTAYRNNQPNLIGFSHDISGSLTPIKEGSRSGVDVDPIAAVHSVDVVADPSAGGRIERLVASVQPGGPMDIDAMLAELDPDDADAAAKIRSHYGLDNAADPPAPTAVTTEEPPATDPVAEAEILTPGTLLHTVAIREATADVPEGLREAIKTKLAKTTGTIADLAAQVTEAADLYTTALAAAGAELPGQGPATGTVKVEEAEKHGKALDALLDKGMPVDGVPAFRSLREAYFVITGRTPGFGHEEDINRQILAESVGAFANPNDQRTPRLMESITSGTWSNALGDSITRRAIAEYNLPELQSWREIVSEITGPTDFRTQRRDRIGGYDVLPTVGEGAPYTALTSPTDEEATYAPTKKGGTEDLTLETIANDDISAVRRIPRNLGRAAGLTLYRAIWVDLIATNPAIYDAVTLFHATHGNTSAVALSEAAIGTARTAMVGQTRLGEPSGFIGAAPRKLCVPTELYTTAYKLTQSAVAVVGTGEAATTPNPWQGIMPIEVPVWTDADDWVMVADPATVPTIEVGFYQGRQEPEILVQDAPAVGSVFTSDKVTYKVRHIWGLTVLDYRGFYKGTQ